MPRKLRMQSLQAELASLNALIESATEADDPVSEFQLDKRRARIESELRSIIDNSEKKASVALFFGGKPVLGSRGISAEFAGKMLENFQSLVARTFAAAELGGLGNRGPIPMKHSTDLMVTNLAKGSFGFVLNEMSDQDEIDSTALKIIVEDVVQTIEKIASPNELDFEAASEQLDPRMLISLKDFFVALDSADGVVRIVDDVADICLDSLSIHRGRLRTEATTIHESDLIIEGILVGFLPEHRKFEMLVGGQMLYGSVSAEASDQYSHFLMQGEVPERQTWKVRMKQRVVTPLNRPAREVNRLMEFIGKADA